jgi:hypothetical protein
MGCCGGGSGQTLKVPPRREPYVQCDGEFVTFAPDAWIIVRKAGLDPCSVTGTGFEGLVTRQDAIRARG